MTGPGLLARWRGKRSMKEAAALLLNDESKWWKYRRWERGERPPSVDDAVVIERVASIPMESWAGAPTRKAG